MSLVRKLVLPDLAGSIRSCVPSSPCLLLVRGKKKDVKKQKKSKKDQKKEATRDLMKRNQIQKLSEEAILGVAKKGEPLDPELLNPARKRPPTQVSEDEREEQVLLLKEWTRYKMSLHKQDLQFLQGMMKSRNKALKELRKVSLPLYKQSLELRNDLFPFTRTGPTTTPPLSTYVPPELAEE